MVNTVGKPVFFITSKALKAVPKGVSLEDNLIIFIL